MILDSKDSAFVEHIWNVSRGTMYHAAFDVLRNRMDAEDVVGDTMERICKNLSKFDGLPPERIRALAMIYAPSPSISTADAKSSHIRSATGNRRTPRKLPSGTRNRKRKARI